MIAWFPTLAAAAGGAVAAWVVGRNAGALGGRLGLLDFPDPKGGRKLHLRVTPLVGGLGVVAATWIGCAATALTGAVMPSLLGWFAIVVTVMFLIGIADDRFGLSPKLRLALAAGVLLLGAAEVPELQIDFLRFAGSDALIPLGLVGGVLFSLLCLVGFLNAVNMADGKDGLVLGQALVWSGVLALRLPPALLPLLAAMAAALAVLFVFNMRGHLFLGDSGSYGLSACFGLLALIAWNLGFADMNADDVALIFAIPVLDTVRLIVWRVVKRKSPFEPGRDHLHHYLYRRWGWPRPLPFVLLLAALPNAAAIALPGTGLVWLAVTAAGYGVMIAAARYGSPRPA